MSCNDQHGVDCACTPATDQEIVDQIETVQQAMFRLETMLGKEATPRRQSIYRVRHEFSQVAFRLIGT